MLRAGPSSSASPGAGCPHAVDALAAESPVAVGDRRGGQPLAVASDADVDTLALTLIGTGHMVFADRAGPGPNAGELDRLVTSIIGPALR